MLEDGSAPKRLGYRLTSREAAGVKKPLNDQAVKDGHDQGGEDLGVEAARFWLCCLELLDPSCDGHAQRIEVRGHGAAQASGVFGA